MIKKIWQFLRNLFLKPVYFVGSLDKLPEPLSKEEELFYIQKGDEEAKAKLEETLTQFKITTADTFANEMSNGNTIGSIAEVYDSKEPEKNVRKLQVMTNDLIERDEIGWVFEKNVMRGKGAFAQGWSVSEVFRIILGK